MRNFYLTFLAIFTLSFLQAQIIDIPDDNFKYLLVYGENVRTVASGSYLVSADSNNDYEIQQSEAEAVVYMRLESFGFEIQSMEGLQHFSNLETLKLEDNYLTTLDVSMLSELRILDCFNNN
ncbi:MAG: Leucine-rich repeat (LRR) protein [Glaciecola sp.]|jgi:Leucine-rich repeat (LRR) protein